MAARSTSLCATMPTARRRLSKTYASWSSRTMSATFNTLGTPPNSAIRAYGPMVERASQFLWMRQLHPAAFSVLHIPAAFSIDAKGPTMAR